MGQRQLIICLFFVVLSQATVDCRVFDSEGSNFRGPEFYLKLQVTRQSNANTNPNVQNLTNTGHSFFWKKNRNKTNQSSYKESNSVWRNPRIFDRIQTTTLYSRHKLKSTVPTHKDFDYSDLKPGLIINTSLETLHKVERKNRRRVLDTAQTRFPLNLRTSSILYRFTDPYDIQDMVVQPTPNTQNNRFKPVLYPAQTGNQFGINKIENIKNNIKMIDSFSNDADFGQNVDSINGYLKSSQASKKQRTTSSSQSTIPVEPTSTTTPDDRVKFFEMYDINTPPNKRIKLNISSEFLFPPNNMTNNKYNNTYQESENFKKLWSVNNLNTAGIENLYKNFDKRSSPLNHNLEKLNKIQESKHSKSHIPLNDNSTLVISKLEDSNISAVSHWSSYPFASVYVYKPSEIYCDAAGLSPHWLLASGACLSRHTLVDSINEQSAYVTYCGENWRSPERVTYVKRSVVHPKFNPKDEVRRLIYNIGLIQVASSMAESCQRWAPIALMSHQFSTSTTGTRASAVGWGLDRYGSQYTPENDEEKIPHLSVYDALVFHNTCPGNSKFSQMKRRDASGANNVYCLTLPTYAGEESDPVHGGLLLVGGHLVALYLQEERSSWGSQSAQYTGVWRLLPWIAEVAQEPDDTELALDQ